MEQVSAQTEKISSYETSRTRRSIVDGSMHSDDSNNDDEYASSGFYVREKTSDKKPDSSDSAARENEKDVKENGISSGEDSSSGAVINGENSKDDENSKDSKTVEKPEEIEAIAESEDKIEPEKEERTAEEEAKSDEVSHSPKENTEDNDVTSSSNNEPQKNACTSSDNDEENDVSSTSNNVDEPKTVDDVEEHKTIDKVEESKTPDNVEEAKTPDNVEEAKTSDNVEEAKTIDKVEEPKTGDKVEEPKTVESEAKEKVDETEKDKDDTEESVKSKKDDADSSKEEPSKESKESDERTKKESNKESKESDEKITEEPNKENNKSDEKSKEETNKESKESDEKAKEIEKSDEKEDTQKAESSEVSILKEQLEKSAAGRQESSDQDAEMDEDFDPSLLCPDISMDVDEASVMNTEQSHEDGSISPLPYEPIFSTLVDEITGAEVQIDLTPHEMKLRQDMYGPNNPVQATKIHCTACNVHLGSALTGANNRFVHPLLKVLICKNCYHFYTSGEFEKDEDGSELYCRWCGQGGQVLCCSSCEFVFCKRCIRNNFGPKKFKQIRDSDDWNCFRCEPEQLSNLRASCAEFMEYYRTELARAHSLAETNPELMSTDYTKCCSAPPEKKEEPKTPAASKTRRKRKDEEDPDYRPVVDEDEPPAKKPAPTTPTAGPGYTVIPPRPVQPKVTTSPTPAVVRAVGLQPVRPQTTTSGQVFKVGNTTFRTRTPGAAGYTIQRPSLNQAIKTTTTSPGYITIPPSSVPKTTTQGYIKILPQRMSTPVRPTGTYTVVSGTSNGKPTFSTVRPVKPNQMPAMKHEWFEKTVRAAARVNSNLSYTLTQLNRQQSQASSVEALAMVHNKLQEVLSTSINSLIQIRKNLRTEFIAGIKNIKFPPKPAPIPPTTGPIVVKDDDDVIFVSPATTASTTHPPPLVLSPAASFNKKPPAQKSDPFSNPKPSTSGVKPNNISKPFKPAVTTTTPSTGPVKGGFLKVRSFTSLQTVPSECITIPDDPPAVRAPVEEDPLQLIEDDPLKTTETAGENTKDEGEESEQNHSEEREVSSTLSSSTVFDEEMVYDVKEKPTPEIQKMMAAYVSMQISPDVDEMIQGQKLVNGDSESDKNEKGSDKKEDDSGTKQEQSVNGENNAD